jgi:hypothetical protein
MTATTAKLTAITGTIPCLIGGLFCPPLLLAIVPLSIVAAVAESKEARH